LLIGGLFSAARSPMASDATSSRSDLDDRPHTASPDDPTHPVIKSFQGQRLDLWSMRPVQPPSVPKLHELPSDRPRPENAIDALLCKQLMSSGKSLAQAADRRALARRLAFDLTGLPASREMVETFLADRRPDAYERLVDRLMATPEFGTHTSRMWLDVVRYSDSNGYDWDEFRPMAWLYRDYVVRSLNQDKPYDEFIREQLAGDELSGQAPESAANPDLWIATAYLRLGPYDNAAQLFDEQDRARAEWMFDLVETTGSAFLGLTFNCCRCHDHKYDPLPQADYYRLQACFQPVEAIDRYVWDARAGLTIPPPAEPPPAESKPARDAAPSLAETDDGSPRAEGTLDGEGNDLESKDDVERPVAPEPPRPPRDHVLLVSDRSGDVSATAILHSGDYQAPREIVEPGFLSLLDARAARVSPVEIADQPAGQPPMATTGRRLALARWIASADNPLTARVIANRLWQSYFGVGIVATPNDFGYAGDRPTHPALLDYLATELIAHHWSLKWLQREIVMSAAYRQQSVAESAEAAQRFAGRLPRRLTAEQVIDSVHAVSGQLRLQQGGPPVWPELPADVLQANPAFLDDNELKVKGWYPSSNEALSVRALYWIQKRCTRIPICEVFDQPDNATSCGRRGQSTVPTQALTLLNSDLVMRAAGVLADQIASETASLDEQVAAACSRILGRAPTADERILCREFLVAHDLRLLCRALMNTNEFVYLD
jgi:hypothetical protein